MFIEDLIQYVTGNGRWLFHHNSVVQGHDYTVLSSMSSQVEYGSQGLTEKQASLALKILLKNRNNILPLLPNFDELLNNPQWKMPFRVLPKNKKITLKTSEAKILVEFQYDQSIVENFRNRNQSVNEIHRGAWSQDEKKWVFNLTERNIDYLGNYLLSKGFEAEEEFLNFYKNITEIQNKIENFLPMLVETEEGFLIKNAHPNITQPTTKNLSEALFWARNYGVIAWDDAIDLRIKNELNSITTEVLSSPGNKQIWFDSDKVDIDYFSDLIKNGGPALVIIPGGNGVGLIKQWNEFAQRIGIKSHEISVMFRLPNEQADFNHYVKEMNLNNPIDENTRLAFVSTKITKPLIKSGVKFNTVINLGYYNYMHFTMGVVVENAQNLVYYSIKEPTRNKRWQPQEL